MASGSEVLELLCPQGGWIIAGNDFANIVWLDDRPKCTKKQFDDTFENYDDLISQKNSEMIQAKSALLARLGISEEEAKLLLS